MKKENERLLFFDIETTGLSPDISAITLIGCLDENGKLMQWFNEDGFSQKEILSNFFAYCRSYDTLLNFNGTTFDLPFLKAKAIEFDLPDPFSSINHRDLYRELLPYRHLFDTKRFRQKDLEQYLGFKRLDKLSGKKAIKTYQDFLKKRDPFLKDNLLLHNREDLSGLSLIASLLCYRDLEEGVFLVDDVTLSSDSLHISLKLSSAFIIPATFEKKGILLKADKKNAELNIFVKDNCVRHYYPNPKDYFYLPQEDTILPKSMGSFVDRSARVAADFDHCYTRFSPTDSFLSDQNAVHTLSQHTIQYLFTKKE